MIHAQPTQNKIPTTMRTAFSRRKISRYTRSKLLLYDSLILTNKRFSYLSPYYSNDLLKYTLFRRLQTHIKLENILVGIKIGLHVAFVYPSKTVKINCNTKHLVEL